MSTSLSEARSARSERAFETPTHPTTFTDLTSLGAAITLAGQALVRYGLVVVLGWIGAMKFTAYEAQAIQPLVASSPFLGWVYGVVDVATFSALLGMVEIAIAALVALRPIAPRLAALGGAAAAGMFLTTLSFLVSTPGWEASLGGFPALSVVPGQFLLKDAVLLGAALWCCGDALAAPAR